MDRVNYVQLFSVPDDYKPPFDQELSSDTQYPNLNSLDYRKKCLNRTPKIHKYFEAFDINDEGQTLLASNDIRGRIWDGCVWGFKDIENLGIEAEACFKLHCAAPITHIKYLKNKIFFITLANGTVQVWSTMAEARKAKDFCLFMVGGKSEHIGIIWAMDIFEPDNTKAVTGTSDGCLKVWDVGAGDIFSINTMRHAHSDHITGISTSKTLESSFVTCSRDKSALIWDYRLTRPATNLFDSHKVPFTSVTWTKDEEKNSNILIGDECGNVYSIDPKMPNKFLDEVTVFNRPVRKIRMHMNKMAVIGNTNLVKAFNCNQTGGYQFLYKDKNAQNLVRDINWNSWDENEFYTISWEGKLNKHVVHKN